MKTIALEIITIAAGILLCCISAQAGTQFAWHYTAEQQKNITRFELVRDAGDTIVMNNIAPDKRAVSYESDDVLKPHAYGLRACNPSACSKLSNLVVVMPPVPAIPAGFRFK